MAIEVETKDTTALSDAELEEMANLSMEGCAQYDIGMISKERENWVLVSQAREGTKLKGFSFFTLERIGGTPSFLIGMSVVKRGAQADSILKAMMRDGYSRAILAFPDEDALVGTRLFNASGFAAYDHLEEIVPRQDHRITGEERQWIRRLAKRFGMEASLDDQTFVVSSSDVQPGLDFESPKPDKLESDYGLYFANVKNKGDMLIGFGWAMAEYLDTFSPDN